MKRLAICYPRAHSNCMDRSTEELDEPDLKDLPRLTFTSNRRSASRLRQLIDHLNTL